MLSSLAAREIQYHNLTVYECINETADISSALIYAGNLNVRKRNFY
jgi:hypothetical protein